MRKTFEKENYTGGNFSIQEVRQAIIDSGCTHVFVGDFDGRAESIRNTCLANPQHRVAAAEQSGYSPKSKDKRERNAYWRILLDPELMKLDECEEGAVLFIKQIIIGDWFFLQFTSRKDDPETRVATEWWLREQTVPLEDDQYILHMKPVDKQFVKTVEWKPADLSLILRKRMTFIDPGYEFLPLDDPEREEHTHTQVLNLKEVVIVDDEEENRESITSMLALMEPEFEWAMYSSYPTARDDLLGDVV